MASFSKNSLQKKIVVLKLGTNILTQQGSGLNFEQLITIMQQCKRLMAEGFQIIIVSSGAVCAGQTFIKNHKLINETPIPTKQMYAAIGQIQLISAWQQIAHCYQLSVGQMLLTRADIEDKKRFINARDMLYSLLDNNIIPIVNENDAVATNEIKLGDNDNLSALVAILAEAKNLIILTDQNGCYTEDPNLNANATLIKKIDLENNNDNQFIAGNSQSGLGTGGMYTKLEAAKLATRAGIPVIIASGFETDVIVRILLKKESIGTYFCATTTPLENRKQWLLGATISGSVVIDQGASIALKQKGSSLLATGICLVKGVFSRGDVLAIMNENNQTIAIGITRYNSEALNKIAGKHSNLYNTLLLYHYGAAVIHRNELILI